jgi:hypothetical protein
MRLDFFLLLFLFDKKRRDAGLLCFRVYPSKSPPLAFSHALRLGAPDSTSGMQTPDSLIRVSGSPLDDALYRNQDGAAPFLTSRQSRLERSIT